MNFCRFCGAHVSPQTSICPQCEKPLQIIADIPTVIEQATLKKAPPINQREPETPFPETELLQQSLTLYRAELAEQQQALAQLRQEIQGQLERQRLVLTKQLEDQKQEIMTQLAKKADRAESSSGKSSEIPHGRRRAMSIFLALVILVGLANPVLILLYSKPTHRLDTLTLYGICLVAFGSFYLAYDLLGGKNGPLVNLTAYATYALIGVLGASIANFLLIFQDMSLVPPGKVLQNLMADPAAGLDQSSALNLLVFTRVALLCVFSGALIGLSGELLARPYKSSRFSWLKTFLIELLYCFVFWALFFAAFTFLLYSPTANPATTILSEVVLGELFLVIPLAIFTTFCVRLYRFVIVNKLSSERSDGPLNMKTRRPWLYQAIFIPSTLLVFSVPLLPIIILILQFFPISTPELLAVALGFVFAGTLATLLAPFTIDWINDRFNKRRLGALGLFIATFGAVLIAIQPLIDLITK